MSLAEDAGHRLLDRMADPELRLQHAMDLASRYLGHRDRTVAEVRRHLEAKRVEPDTIDEVVAELSRMGYLDDVRYAQRFTADRRTLDGWGAERIGRRLLAAGVAPDVAEAAVGGREADDELQAALALLQRRFGAGLADDRERERALGHLVRKGYELDLAYDAVRAHARRADAA
ncbi:MAG TPA: regulatory protein RecX [Baekduia sp.]|nr:regulatory protein RecX [Baekduia sp.]